MKTVGVGVIGCGKVAEWGHLPAYQAATGAKIIGISDRDQDRLQWVARRFRIERTFPNYKELLEDDDVNAVSICAPTYLHHDIAIAAIQRGKHVLCEKPLALTTKEGEQMIEESQKAHVQLYVGFTMRFSRVLREMIAFLHDGLISGTTNVSLLLTADTPPTGSWYWERQKGGGSLFDQGAHAADFFLHFFGNPRVSSAKFTVAENGSTDIAAHVPIQFNENLSGSIDTDWRSRSGSEIRVNVEGQDGSLTADVLRSTLRVRHRRSIIGKMINGFTMTCDQGLELHKMEIWEFLRTIRTGEEASSLATGQDGINALQLIENAYKYFGSTGNPL